MRALALAYRRLAKGYRVKLEHGRGSGQNRSAVHQQIKPAPTFFDVGEKLCEAACLHENERECSAASIRFIDPASDIFQQLGYRGRR